MSHFVSISTVMNVRVTDVFSVIMLVKLLVILLYLVFPQVNPQTLDLHTSLLNNKKYKKPINPQPCNMLYYMKK